MKTAIDLIGEEKCAGCFGCYNSCPVNAIAMNLNDEGFYIPVVDNKKCIDCGVCQKHCPVIVKNTADKNSSAPEVYAAWSKDEDTRVSSSSGGVFTELALETLKTGGVVFGVVWNSNFLAEHIKVETAEQLSSLKGSKYIQSNVGNSYRAVITELNKGKNVLFSGTPCQIATLKTFTNSDSLITVDLICHGVPSILAFKKYLELREPAKIKKINCRDKITGWSNFSLSIEYADGTGYFGKFDSDDFCRGFNDDLYQNNLCYECPFAALPRQGDITIGDFWGVPQELHDEKGVSVILINNEKGEKFFKKINSIETIAADFEVVLKGNLRLIDGNKEKPEARTELLEDLKKHDFDYIAEKYLKNQE